MNLSLHQLEHDAASHAAPWRVTVSMPTGQTDGRQRPLYYAFRLMQPAY